MNSKIIFSDLGPQPCDRNTDIINTCRKYYLVKECYGWMQAIQLGQLEACLVKYSEAKIYQQW